MLWKGQPRLWMHSPGNGKRSFIFDMIKVEIFPTCYSLATLPSYIKFPETYIASDTKLLC